MTKYVFDGTEVEKTGRRAVKKVPIPGKQPREFEIFEIRPIDADFDWKKWVRQEDLFEIMEDEG